MYVKNFSHFRKSKRISESLSLFEAVVNFDKNLIDVLNQFIIPDKNDSKFLVISKTILSAIESGQDFKSNRFDQVSLSSDKKNLSVKSGKQTNTQSLAKVIRTTLLAIDPDFFKNNPTIKDDTIQKFTDIFMGKLATTSPSSDSDIKIVTGDEIKYWYDRNNMNDKPGSELSKSCMANASKLSFMDFYAKNKSISLVIITENEKLSARALLWKLDKSNEGFDYYLDRCYCNENSDEERIYNWLISQPKYSNLNRKNMKRIESIDKDEMRIELDNAICDFYPYVDTMRYLYIKLQDENLVNEGFLSNKLLGEDVNEWYGAFHKKVLEGYATFLLQTTDGIRQAVSSRHQIYENKPLVKVINGVKIDIVEYQNPLDDIKNAIKVFEKGRSGSDPMSLFDIVLTTEDKLGSEVVNAGTMYFKKDIVENVLNTPHADEIAPRFLCLRAYDVSKLVKSDPLFADIYETVSTSNMNKHKTLMTEVDLVILGKLDLVKSDKVYYVDATKLWYLDDPQGQRLTYDDQVELEEKANQILSQHCQNKEALELRKKWIEYQRG